MALSNWATMAFDKDGIPSDGSLTSYKGISAEIYKNWIYLKSERLSLANSFVEPTFAEIQHGTLQIHDLNLRVIRNPMQQAVFIFASSYHYLDKDYKNKESNWMAGIGCSGYKNSEWVGVTPKLAERFFNWLDKFADNIDFWLDEKSVKEWITKCRDNHGRHFNQGDAYFENYGLGEAPMLPPGEATEPVAMKIIKGMK